MVITSVFCILTCIFKSLILQSVGNKLNNEIRPNNDLTSIQLAVSKNPEETKINFHTNIRRNIYKYLHPIYFSE